MTKHTIADKKSTSRNHAHKKNHVHEETKKIHRNHHPKLNGLLTFEDKEANTAAQAIAIGLAGIAAFLFLKPKKRKIKSKNLYNAYRDFKDEAEEFALDAYEKGKNAYDSAIDYAENIRETAEDVMEQPYFGLSLLTGAIGGTLLGASAVYLLNSHSKKDESILDKAIHVFDKVKDATHLTKDNKQLKSWIHTAKDMIETVVEELGAFSEEESDASTHHSSHHLKTAAELALNGLHLWKHLKHKRK